MNQRKKVVLFNPEAVFFDMPLALLAVGSVLDPEKYEVVILDARIEDNIKDLVLEHIPDALCFGTSVITGAPIKSALEICELVKATRPDLPIIWGGWHASLFPESTLKDEACIDITVQGQGEITFQELVKAFDEGLPLKDVAGICFWNEEGKVVKNKPRKLEDMGSFKRINYDLIDVEKYFEKKGMRQFDYISSTGCFFRCAFCADPFVFGRSFTCVPADQMGEDLEYYYKKYKFTDINFQDETFFTYAKRIKAFAEELIKRDIKTGWAATMRADQGERLPDDVWELCKKSGLRRLLIGVESGSQEMMDWLKKDIKLTQVFNCADKCAELDIGVIFPFIVGFPGESDKSIEGTVATIKKLRGQSEKFETPIFYFKPYPGSSITQEVVKHGYKLPASTREWSDFDYIGSSGPWVSPEKERFFEAFKFYLKAGFGKTRPWAYPLRKISQWRCEKEQFKFPIEKYLVEKIRPKQKLS